MSAVLETPPSGNATTPEAGTGLPDASVLEDKTPVWFRTPPITALFTVVIGVTFLLMAARPLWHTDLWDHINYGQATLDHRGVSWTETSLPLAAGMPMINIPWLVQVAFAQLNHEYGLAALQFLYAACVAAALGLVAWCATTRGHSALAGFLAAGLFFKTNLDQLLVIRPQLPGLVFFCIVVAWMYSRQRTSRAAWIGLPIMFAAWANCHGSFSLGLVLMGISIIGRFLDVASVSRSSRLAFRDPQLLQTVLLLQLCAVAVLINPYGFAVYPEVFLVAGNANVDSMFEWDALTLRSPQGQSAAAACILTLVALKLTTRRVRAAEYLAFTAFGLLAMWSARMLNWWTPIMAIMAGVHLLASARATVSWLKPRLPGRRTGLWTVVNLLLVLVVIAPCTNLGIQLLHGRQPDPARLVSSQTPVETARFLHEQTTLPPGIACVPAEWAGFLVYAGPRGLQPMVNLHVHVIPEEVWGSYMKLLSGPSDWQPVMNEFGINLVVVDKERHPGLLKRLQDSPDWTSRYQDHQAAVFFRNHPL